MGTWPALARSQEAKNKIKDAKVLCVGAGGIGCELLKTLVLTGFVHIHVIDMDTIETSNLNRQFLFRKHHVGESKAKVAAEAVKRFRPNARIQADQGNVKEPQYDVDFFKSFDLVMNGLDNLEARRHVNRLCLAAETPLIESGTAGYLGQATVHIRGKTECFECRPKQAPKTYPVCTIRNTPDKPIHCIVWAKDLLFQRLFGRADAVTDLDEGAGPSDPTQGPADGQSGAAPDGQSGAAPQAAGEQEAEDPSAFLQQAGEAPDAYAHRIFDRVYGHDIERVLRMEDLWQARKPPTALHLADPQLAAVAKQLDSSNSHRQADGAGPISACKATGLTDQHKDWSLQENTQIFLKAIQLFLQHRSQDVGAAVFDKDDDLAVEFVTAAANLRSIAYDIPTQSLFAAKGMAGNIIHAIATTNAIIAGFIVVEAIKVLTGAHEACKASFLMQRPVGNRFLIQPLEPNEPAKDCMVCGTAQLQLTLNTAAMTLAQFVNKVLKGSLSVHQPTIMCDDFVYEEGDDLDEEELAANAANLPKALQALPGGGLKHGSIVQVDDQAQHFKVSLVVSHQEDLDEEEFPEGFKLSGAVPEAQPDTEAPEGTAANLPVADDEDDCMIVEPKTSKKSDSSAGVFSSANGKRKRSAETSLGADTDKKLKLSKPDGDVIMLD
ncbi:hypothetical protein ABBQ38_004726 [Trebouxia sp. C0009 RCD-2024]